LPRKFVNLSRISTLSVVHITSCIIIVINVCLCMLPFILKLEKQSILIISIGVSSIWAVVMMWNSRLAFLNIRNKDLGTISSTCLCTAQWRSQKFGMGVQLNMNIFRQKSPQTLSFCELKAKTKFYLIHNHLGSGGANATKHPLWLRYWYSF
jgi:hypothetical protein